MLKSMEVLFPRKVVWTVDNLISSSRLTTSKGTYLTSHFSSRGNSVLTVKVSTFRLLFLIFLRPPSTSLNC